mgnify:CR=1 FL=1
MTGQLMLVDETYSSDGNTMTGGVAVYAHGQWGTICDDNIDENGNFAAVAATEFGFHSCHVIDWDGTYTGMPINFDS